MPKKVFKFTLRAKGSTKIFREALGPGVLASQKLEFDLPDDYNEVMFAAELLRQEEAFIERCIEVEIKEED